MEAWNIEKTAKFLDMNKETLRRKARKGDIPAQKTGRQWMFLDENIAEWMKGNYAKKDNVIQLVPEKAKKCPSINAGKVKSGGFKSQAQMDSAYKLALGLK